MVSTGLLLLQAGVQLASAVLYIWVGSIVASREVEGEARRANALFATWWYALGIVYIMIPFFTIPTRILGYRDLALSITLINVLLTLIVVAVWGLVYYLLYLYTGDRRWFWPVTVFYGALALGLLYLIAWLDPTGFDDTGMLVYSHQQLQGAPSIALGLSFSLPVVLAAIAYGTLFFRVKEPAPRYRVGLVSGAFIVQFGWSVLSTALQLNQRYPNSITLSLVGNVLAIAAAIAIVLAFRPPEGVRRKLGVA